MNVAVEARWIRRETTGFGKYALNLPKEFNQALE